MQPWAVSCPVEWLLYHRKQLLIRGWPTTIVQADRPTHVPALIPSRRLSSLVAIVVVVGHNYSRQVYFSERARTDINARLPFTATADESYSAASTPTTLDTCVHLNYILRKCEPAARPTDPARSDSRMSMAALRRNSRTVADPLSAGRCDDDDRQYHQTSPGVIRVTDNIYSDQPALRPHD